MKSLQINVGRFRSLPNILKPLQLLLIVFAMISMAAAPRHDFYGDFYFGDGFFWFTTILSLLFCSVVFVLCLFDSEMIVFMPVKSIRKGNHDQYWYLCEFVYASVIAFFYFVFICISIDNNARRYRFIAAGYNMATIFCAILIGLFVFDAVLSIRIWKREKEQMENNNNSNATAIGNGTTTVPRSDHDVSTQC